MKRIAAFLILFFIFLVRAVVAARFSATISPTFFIASETQEFSLQIINHDSSVNITNVSVTLLEGFEVDSCTNCNISSNILIWQREIEPSENGNFNFYAKAKVNGTYKFNVSSGYSNGILVQNLTNNFEVNDTKPPECYNNLPENISLTYSPNRQYRINATCEDNVNLSTIVLFWNGTQIPFYAGNKTYTANNNFVDLPTGTYLYYWVANDTNGNSFQTSTFTLNVTKAPNPLNVYMNDYLNQNISITNNTTLTISVKNFAGNLTIYRTGPENYTYEPDRESITLNLKTIGLTNFTFSVTGNENYTSNRSTFFVIVVPTFSISTSIPSTPTSNAYFNIEFSSPPHLDSVLIQGTWSGSLHQMTNSSSTKYSYSISLRPGSYQWRLHANKSGIVIPLTSYTSFSVGKSTPSLMLTASPSWIVEHGTQTTVRCLSPTTVKLYRNRTLVSNPDIQTLAIGNYTYVCESEETENYTSVSGSAVLRVGKNYYADLSFTSVPSFVLVQKGSSNSTLILVKNTGNINQTVSLLLENISINWSVNASDVKIVPNEITAFLLILNATDEDTGNYTAVLKAQSPDKIITHEFIIKIEISEEEKSLLISTIEAYKADVLSIEAELNKSKERGVDVSNIESTFLTFKSLIYKAEEYVQLGRYDAALKILEGIGNLPEIIKNQISIFKSGPSYTLYIIIGVTTGICSFLAYLLWPTEAIPKQKAKERKQALVQTFKQIFSRKANNK